MASGNIFMSVLALFWFMLVMSVVLPKHQHMSTVQKARGRLEGFFPKGKAKVNVTRHPFWWSMPAKTYSGMTSFFAGIESTTPAVLPPRRELECSSPSNQNG